VSATDLQVGNRAAAERRIARVEEKIAREIEGRLPWFFVVSFT
jgi:hypothetical protein